MIKKLIVFTLISLFTLTSWAGLKEELKTKTENYTALETYYSALLKHIEDSDTKAFCATNEEAYPTLIKILEDDNNLIQALRQVQNQDYYDYATHLEENSASPLFSFYAYQETCQSTDQSIFLQMSQSMKYHVMNISYLKMNHEMWVAGFGADL